MTQTAAAPLLTAIFARTQAERRERSARPRAIVLFEHWRHGGCRRQVRDFEGEAAGRRPSREALARQRKEEEAGSPWSEKER